MKKNIFLLIILFVVINPIFAQFDPFSIYDITEIPKGIANIDGEFETGYSWKDKNGINYFFTTLDGEGEYDTYSKYMYAYHYIKTDDGFKLLRKTIDFVKDCEFDVILDLYPNSIIFLDLDKDGYTEITYTYKLACTSDISPCTAKLIMLENGDKYAIRGTEALLYYGEFSTSDYKIDAAFNKAPKSFLPFAKVIWNKYCFTIKSY